MTPIDNLEERGFFQRHGFAIGVAGTVLIGLFIIKGRSLFSGNSAVQHKPVEVTIVRIAPPPPPPPPPQTVQEQKMLEQPKDSADEPPDEPTPVAGTSIQGRGPADGFGVSANTSGNFIGSVGKKISNNPFGGYAAQVQATITDALSRNPRTRDASFRIVVRIWPDVAGRITRAQLAGTTGDAAVDNAITHDVLTGLQLSEPPPEGMPFPIVMRLTARRPN